MDCYGKPDLHNKVVGIGTYCHGRFVRCGDTKSQVPLNALKRRWEISFSTSSLILLLKENVALVLLGTKVFFEPPHDLGKMAGQHLWGASVALLGLSAVIVSYLLQ